MDQREAMSTPGSSSYYVPQGTAESMMGLQGSPRMNSLSNPSGLFGSNIDGTLVGSSLPFGSSSTMSPHGIGGGPPPPISVGPPPAMLQGGPVRRKRGRPRKYGRDASVSLALSPSTSSHVPTFRPSQKRRGRPPGTGRKQQLLSLGGSTFSGPGKMIPHVIIVAPGEDVKAKILSFAQGRQNTVILSGIGLISAVELRIAVSGATVTHEGCFEIVTLNGSFTHNDVNAPVHQGPVGCLNLGLTGGHEGHNIIGGVVEGVMIAASNVQVVVASLLPRVSKAKSNARQNPEASADGEDRGFGNLVAPAF